MIKPLHALIYWLQEEVVVYKSPGLAGVILQLPTIIKAHSLPPLSITQAWNQQCGCSSSCVAQQRRWGQMTPSPGMPGSFRPYTARPASAYTAPSGGRWGSSAKVASRRASAAAAQCAPGRRGRPAEGTGSIWGSVMRGYCVSTRSQQLKNQVQRERGSVRQVRLKCTIFHSS